MVEVVTATLEDQLVDPLSFRLTKTASYITKRRSCTFHASGSNIYHPTTGVKLIKIPITGQDWLDPSTFRIMFDLKNEDSAKPLYPVGGVCFFSIGSAYWLMDRWLRTSVIITDVTKCFKYLVHQIAEQMNMAKVLEIIGKQILHQKHKQLILKD